MTSLATQLKRLAVKPQAQVQADHLRSDKQRASLLFDLKEAANLDRDTVYSLGCIGLEELALIDPSFLKFERSIFHSSSKTLERSIQAKDVNHELNRNIANFLVRLSPYFLLKPAHKCLEWLIHRFHIHVYNVDDLMRCVLPYHDANMFVKVVQLLKLDTPRNRWAWLAPLQKAGVPLDKKSLVRYCSKDLGFLSFVCDMVPTALKVYGYKATTTSMRVLFSFYASTVVQTLHSLSNVSNELVAQLVPFLVKGLRSGLKDYTAATYLILSQLAKVATLDQKVVRNLLADVCKGMMANQTMEALGCIVVIFQLQKMKKIPDRVVEKLAEQPQLVADLQLMSEQYDIGEFLSALCCDLLSAALPLLVAPTSMPKEERKLGYKQASRYLKFLIKLVQDVPLGKQVAMTITKCLLTEYCSAHASGKKTARKRLRSRVQPLVRTMEIKYPETLDAAVEVALKNKHSKKMRPIVEHFISMSLTPSKHQLMIAGGSLVLGLQHPIAVVRCLAVKQLYKAWRLKQITDDGFVREAILARLADEDDTVVYTVLNDEQFWSIKDSDQLFHTLVGLTHRPHWGKVQRRSLMLLCSAELTVEQPDMLAALVMRHVLVTTNSRKLAKSITSSAFARQHPLLAGLQKGAWADALGKVESKSEVTEAYKSEVNLTLVQHVSDAVLAMESSERARTLEVLVAAAAEAVPHQMALRWLVMSVLCHVLSRSEADEERVQVGSALLALLTAVVETGKLGSGSTAEKDEDRSATTSGDVFTQLKSDVFPFEVVRSMTETLVKNISLPEEFKSKVWWCTMADEHSSLQKSVSMVIKLYSFLTTHASEGHHVAEFRELSQMFFKDHFCDKTMLLSFLGNIWASGAPYSETPAVQEITPIMKIRALHIGKVALEMATKNDVFTALSISSDVLPSLLVALASPLQPIRSCTLQCLQTVNSVCKDDNYTNSVLIKALCERAEEIIADRNYLPQLFRDLFSNDVASPQKRRKSVSKSKMGSKVLEGIVLCASSEETSDFVQEKLLWCLSELNSNEVLLLLQPPLARLVALARDDSASMSRHQVVSLQFILRKFTELTAGILSVELELFQLFQQALLTPRRPQADMLSPQAMAFAQLTKLAFAAMSPAAQQTLLATLIDLLVDGTDADIVDDIRRALKTIALDAPRLVAEIDKLLRLYATEGATIRKPRSARVTRAAAERGDAVAMETETSESTTPLIDDRPWRRVILILEVMHQKKKIRNIQLLVPCLFTLLGRCLEMEVTPSSEYVKQLLLSCVQHACTRLSPDHAPVDAATLAPRQFNVELVVACIRGSANPLTHQHALMLLTVAAQMFPVHVLHNIMSIFTFMGANLLRQDDSYSFQVISNTVKTVIPAMVKASEESQSEEECSDMIVSIVQVFVDAFPHIPAHRRLPLFTELINTVGSRRHLWTVLALLFELHVTKTAADVPEWHEKTSLHPDLEFCLELCAAFPPSTQASAMRSLFAHMQALPQEKSDDPHGNQQTPVRKTPAKRQKVIRGMKESTKQLFHVSQHTSKELRHFKFVSIHFATLLLSCPAFVAQVVNLSDAGAEAMKPVYQLLLEETLRAIYQLARKADTATQKPVGKFHKALLHKAYDVLEKVNSLLPSEAFLSVIQGLMGNERLSIRRKALELLNSRLHSQLYQQQAFFKQEQVPVLLALVPELLAVAQEQDSGQEMAVNKQTALFSLKLLCRALGDEHPDTFKKVLHAVIAIVTEAGLNAAVLASALLCLAELCSCLKAHTISSLSVMMPKLLNVLSDAEQLASNDLLMLSSVTCLHKIVESVPNFLSPYMEEIIFRVSWLSSSEHGVNTHEAHLHIRLKALRHNLATTVAPRVLVPAITQGYTKLTSTGKKAIGFLMSILSERLSSMSKDELTGHHQQIVSLFMNVLDFRTQHPTESTDVIMEVEGHVIEAILAMVMKMSEQTFRPMFYKLYDWATRPETLKDRVLTFYRLVASIADKLKGLFVLFAGHLVTNAATLLATNNSINTDEAYFDEDEDDASEQKSVVLLGFIISCLHSCFLYDTQGFVNKERFEALLHPLADQLENLCGGEELYNARVEEHLVPCLVQFAVAASDDSLWKQLNYQVLLKSRHASATVRLGALKVVEQFTHKLGEEYMNLLPETLPFLAELMEDESLEVERYCQDVVQLMEKVLGEPLQKYF